MNTIFRCNKATLVIAVFGALLMLVQHEYNNNKQLVQKKRNLINVSEYNDKDERIKDLEYENAMLLSRSRGGGIKGPIRFSSLPSSEIKLFETWSTKVVGRDRMSDGTGGQSNAGQVPPQVTELGLMSRTKDGLGWEKKWSKRLVNTLMQNVLRDIDISPPHYPDSALQVQQALKDHVINGHFAAKLSPRIMIGGSISPWVESIVLALTGVSKVWVVDYQPIDMSDEDRVECILMDDLKSNRPEELFDIIISYSSIEHDGLGRYGDPVNPHGDMAAVAEFYTLLNPGGLLLLGVPRSHLDVSFVEGNAHRLYNHERREVLTRGFDVIDTVEAQTKSLGWQDQPIMVMRKRMDQLPAMLDHKFSI